MERGSPQQLVHDEKSLGNSIRTSSIAQKNSKKERKGLKNRKRSPDVDTLLEKLVESSKDRAHKRKKSKVPVLPLNERFGRDMSTNSTEKILKRIAEFSEKKLKK